MIEGNAATGPLHPRRFMSQVTFGSVIKKSGTYAVSFVINRGLSFLLIPLYTRYLTTTDYGVLELLDLTMNFVIVFAGSRLGQALFYYYFSEQDQAVREKHISTSIVGSFGLGAILFAVAFPTAGLLSRLVFGTPQYTAYFQLVSVSMALTIPQETYLCAVRAFNEPRFYTVVSVARTLIAGTVNIVLLTGWNMGVKSMLWSWIVSQACLFVILTWFVFRRVPLSFSWGLLRKQAEYSIPLSFGSVGEFVLNYGDRYFLRQSVSLSEIGVYSLAYKIAMMLPTVQWPFALYWSSQQVQLVSGAGGERLFVRVCTYLTLGLTFVAVLITLFVHPLLHVMVSPGFRSAGKYVPWLTLAYLIRAVGGHFREVFVIKKRPSLDARVNWLGTLICLTGYAILIPKMGVWGAVFATVGSFAVLALYGFVAAQNLWRVHYEYDRLLKISVSAALPVGVFYWLQPESFWMQAGLGVLLTLASAALLQASHFWHDDEKEYVHRLWMGLQARRQRVQTDVA